MVGTSPATVDDLSIILDSQKTRQMAFSHTGEVQRSRPLSMITLFVTYRVTPLWSPVTSVFVPGFKCITTVPLPSSQFVYFSATYTIVSNYDLNRAAKLGSILPPTIILTQCGFLSPSWTFQSTRHVTGLHSR